MSEGEIKPVIIDYQEVHLQKLIITNDKAVFESYKQAGNVGLLFDPEVMKFSGLKSSDDLFIVGILLDKPGSRY